MQNKHHFQSGNSRGKVVLLQSKTSTPNETMFFNKHTMTVYLVIRCVLLVWDCFSWASPGMGNLLCSSSLEKAPFLLQQCPKANKTRSMNKWFSQSGLKELDWTATQALSPSISAGPH